MEAAWQTGVTGDGGMTVRETSLLLNPVDLCFVSCASTKASSVWNVDLSRVGEGVSPCDGGVYLLVKKPLQEKGFS